jgi:uncharacterized repeat protein (TIGR02543 family)
MGSTTIHVQSFYDGYVKDIPISVTGPYYYVYFNGNGASGTTNTMTVKRDTNQTLVANGFYKTGYVFKSWNTKQDGSGVEYLNKQTIYNIAPEGGSITLYAQWEPITYMIRYNANGGTGRMDMQQFTYNETGVLSKNTFSRDNYTFIGWNTKANGTGKSYNNQESVRNLTDDDGLVIDLYAQWKSNYTCGSSKYKIDNTNKFIDLIPKSTTKNAFINNLNTNYNVVVNLGSNNYIYTGSKTELYAGSTKVLTYTNIVRGDINGDGKISALDYVMVKNHIMRTSVISNKVNVRAADVNNDGNISALDYVSIKNLIMRG